MLEKILLIEADVESRSRLFDVLSSSGYKITCVPAGKEALKILTEERFNLIIISDNIKDMVVQDIVTYIRKFDSDVRIVLLYESRAEISECPGITISIRKDFSSHIMFKVIFELLKQKSNGIVDDADKKDKAVVLVVDDNKEVRTSLGVFLEKKGYSAIMAVSGEEAVMEAKNTKPDVILLDIRMPGMDGLVALKQIKDVLKDSIVIILTSAQESYMAEEAKRLGAVDYLTKPCDLNVLESTILSALAVKKIRKCENG
jgi:two-component system, response regulator, stage 0 sporulation protein F